MCPGGSAGRPGLSTGGGGLQCSHGWEVLLVGTSEPHLKGSNVLVRNVKCTLRTSIDIVVIRLTFFVAKTRLKPAHHLKGVSRSCVLSKVVFCFALCICCNLTPSHLLVS